MTDARIVYASPDNLYLATERWADRPTTETPTEAKPGVTTDIHRFDISSPTRTRYRGSGEVTGSLLDQWSLSESAGCCASSAQMRRPGSTRATRRRRR